MIDEGLKMLTYPRHLWLLSSDDSLACHTYVYCDMGHPFIMVISEDPWHSHLLQRVWQCCHYLFLRLRSSNTQSSACAANALTHCATAAAPIESCAILHFEDTCIPFTPKFFVQVEIRSKCMKIFKSCQYGFVISLFSPRGKGCGLSFAQNWILFIQRCFELSFVEIGFKD